MPRPYLANLALRRSLHLNPIWSEPNPIARLRLKANSTPCTATRLPIKRASDARQVVESEGARRKSKGHPIPSLVPAWRPRRFRQPTAM